MKDYYTPLEMCEKLEISRSTLTTWTKEGIIPSYTFGHGSRRYDRKKIDQWIEDQKEEK